MSNGAQFVPRPEGVFVKCRDLADDVQSDQKTILAKKSLDSYHKYGEIEIGDKIGGQTTPDNGYLGTVTDIFIIDSRLGPMKQYIVKRDDGMTHYLFEPEIYKVDSSSISQVPRRY